MSRIVIVLPAYNEAASLPPLLATIATFTADAGHDAEVIVVDDGSTDGTSEAATSHPAQLAVRVLRNERNLGLGETFKRGILLAIEGTSPDDIVVSMDADGTHPAEIVPRMVELIRDGHDAIIASRFQQGSQIHGVPLHRRILSRGMSLLFRAVLPIPGVRDYSCGYRAYAAGALMRARDQFGPALFDKRGFVCMVDLLVKLDEMNASIAETPMTLRYDRKRGRSKMPVGRTVGDTLALLAKTRWSRVTARTAARNGAAT